MFASVDVDECPNLPDLPPALPTFKVYRHRGIVDTASRHSLDVPYLCVCRRLVVLQACLNTSGHRAYMHACVTIVPVFSCPAGLVHPGQLGGRSMEYTGIDLFVCCS